MITEIKVNLPERRSIPKTSIYTKIFTEDHPLGDRDVMILLPGGPGNDHTMYDKPENSIAKALLPFVNIILFDPRGCGHSDPSAVEYCSLEHYIDYIKAIRIYFKLPPQKLIVFRQSYG